MKPELYNDLKKYAYSSFEYAHAGLYTLLKSDKNFVNHMERKYRLKQYEQSGDFYMTANERWFHRRYRQFPEGEPFQESGNIEAGVDRDLFWGRRTP